MNPTLLRIPLLVSGALAISLGAVSCDATRSPEGAVKKVAAKAIYVSPGGSDGGSGSQADPVQTIKAALQRSPNGGRIIVNKGSYPTLADESARARTVVITGRGRPILQGVQLKGSERLTIQGMKIVGGVSMAPLYRSKITRPSRAIRLVDNDVTTASTGYCVFVRQSIDIRIDKNRLHDCQSGIAGPGKVPPSSEIRIEGNLIERMTTDGIQFGDWNDVVIRHNTIRDLVDPRGVQHNDAIQFTGGSSRTLVENNVLARSRSQLMLIQAAVGPVRDVLVKGNLLVGSGGFGIQVINAYNVRIARNTLWRIGAGGILVRGVRTPSGEFHAQRDTVVVDNVLTGLAAFQGAAIARKSGNIFACRGGKSGESITTTLRAAASRRCIRSGDFANAKRFDFRLRDRARARRAGFFPSRVP